MYPYIFIFDMRFSAWTFMLWTGFFIAYILAILMRPKDCCLSRQQIAIAMFATFAIGLMGAKLLHILLYSSKYIGHAFNAVWSAAGASYPGAFVFGVLFLYIYAKESKNSFLCIIDYIAIFAMLGQAIGRIGCVLAGCCHGCESLLPWAITFPALADNIPRHPTQAYEMIYALAIFITALRFYPRIAKMRGATFFLVYFAYSFTRFFNEFLRPDSPFVIWPLKLSHIGMIGIMIFCAIGLYRTAFNEENRREFLKLLPQIATVFVLSLIILSIIILGILTFIIQ